MKELTTRVGTYPTGDAVADAVLNYSLALARAHRVDLVDIPFHAPSGEEAHVQLRVGWMVDMDVISRSRQDRELSAPEVAGDLARRARALRSRGDTPLRADELLSWDGLGEY